MPPEVVVLNGIVDLPLALGIDERGDGGLLPPLVDQPVHGHEPAHEKAVFPEGKNTTARIPATCYFLNSNL